MRVLILSITAGQGHHAAGKSISDALTARGAEVMTIDASASHRPPLTNSASRAAPNST